MIDIILYMNVASSNYLPWKAEQLSVCVCVCVCVVIRAPLFFVLVAGLDTRVCLCV